MQAAAVRPLALLQEMHPSSQQEHSQAAALPAEPGTHLLLQVVPVGMLAAVHQAVPVEYLVALTAVCLAALVQKAPAKSRSSRQSILLICRP